MNVVSFSNLNHDEIKNNFVPKLQEDYHAFDQYMEYIDTLKSLDHEDLRNFNFIYGYGNIEIKIKLLEKFSRKFKDIEMGLFNLDNFFYQNESKVDDKVRKVDIFEINEKLNKLYPGLGHLISITEEEFTLDLNKVQEITQVSHLVDRFNDKLQSLIYKNLDRYWNASKEYLANYENENSLQVVLDFLYTYSDNNNIKNTLTKQLQPFLVAYRLAKRNQDVNKLQQQNKIPFNTENKVEEIIEYQQSLPTDSVKFNNYEEFKEYILKNISSFDETEKYKILEDIELFSLIDQKEIINLFYLALDSNKKNQFLSYLLESGYLKIFTDKENIDFIFNLNLTIPEKLNKIVNLSIEDNYYLFEKVYNSVSFPLECLNNLIPRLAIGYLDYCLKKCNKIEELLFICEFLVENNKLELWERLKQKFINKAFSLKDSIDNKIEFIKQAGVLREFNEKIRFLVYTNLYNLGTDTRSSIQLVLKHMEYPEDCFNFLQKKYIEIDESDRKIFLDSTYETISKEQEDVLIMGNIIHVTKNDSLQPEYLRNAYKCLKREYEAFKYSSVNEDLIREKTILDVSKAISNFTDKFEQRLHDYERIDLDCKVMVHELKGFKYLLRDSLKQIGIVPIVPLENNTVSYFYRHHEPYKSYQQPTEGDSCRVVTNGLKVRYQGSEEIIALAKVDAYGVDDGE